jgi:hypothetical protein
MRRFLLYFIFASVAILFSGCTHTTYIADSKNPEVEFSEDGGLMWRGRFIELEELPELLEDAGVDKKSQVDIRVSERMRSLKAPRTLLFILRRAGYTRGVLVTKKKAYSSSTMPPPKQTVQQPQLQQRSKIRYK